MWELGTAVAAVAALLLPAPAHEIPPLPLPESGTGCVVPVRTVLDPCPPEQRRPPVLCIVPVTRVVPAPVEPACPQPVPDPRGRIVPLSP